jgi:hypothetical protein
MIWSEFEGAAPELAQSGRERFGLTGVALIGTIRKDGSPRISPIEPFFAHGQLLLGMLWASKKALDLRRDARCVIHSVVSDVDGSEGEFKLRGQAIEVQDLESWQRYREVFAERWGLHTPEHFHIFSVEIESVSFIGWEENGQWQIIKHWAKDVGLKETRRKVV